MVYNLKKFVPSINKQVMTSIIKSIIIFILSFIVTKSSAQSSSDKQDIVVKIVNVKSDEGKIYVGLYDSENSFLKTTYRGQVLAIENNTCKTIFKDVPSGEYAISIYHDVNSNAKLDKNFLGIPKEDYTCSNGAMGFMGPPKWNDAKFILENTTSYQELKF